MSNVNNFVLNRIFTKSTFSDIINDKNNDIYLTVINNYISEYQYKNNREIICELYKKISTEYRNEYFYKNTLLNKLLIGRHSVNTTIALTEIPINKSKADFILINGEAQVYEIKTELDNFDRIESQINDYFKAFEYVNIVTCEKNLKKIISKITNKNVGIILLTNKNTLRIIKEPIADRTKLEIGVLFKILRKKEFESIIKSIYHWLPLVPPVKYYDACFELLEKIDVNLVYEMFVQQLKMRSRIEKDSFLKVPKELKFLIYFSNYLLKDYAKLESFLCKECTQCISRI